jgi:hypothetical protein
VLILFSAKPPDHHLKGSPGDRRGVSKQYSR